VVANHWWLVESKWHCGGAISSRWRWFAVRGSWFEVRRTPFPVDRTLSSISMKSDIIRKRSRHDAKHAGIVALGTPLASPGTPVPETLRRSPLTPPHKFLTITTPNPSTAVRSLNSTALLVTTRTSFVSIPTFLTIISSLVHTIQTFQGNSTTPMTLCLLLLKILQRLRTAPRLLVRSAAG
jgi:hypothetical protein